MPGVTFDRAASFYDATRALPDGVAEEVADAILRRVAAGPDTRFLGVGIGTGRVALPLIAPAPALAGDGASGAGHAVEQGGRGRRVRGHAPGVSRRVAGGHRAAARSYPSASPCGAAFRTSCSSAS